MSEPVRAQVGCDESEATSGGGGRDVLVGGLWFFGGTIVTLWSYHAAASDPRGGHYLVAWGAMLFGGLQFARGLSRGI